MSLRRALLAVALVAASGVARPDSLASLPDPLYAHDTPPQPEAIFPRIRNIVYPTMGLPALVPYGGELEVVVHTASPEGDPAKWRVELLLRPTGTAARFVLPVVALTRDRGRPLTRLRVRVPARAPRDSYDLQVSGPLVRDTQPNAVRVYGEAKRQFRLAVITDHQLWDPSWKVHPGDRNALDYPRRGEPEGNRAISRQELAELALLDPEFVVHSGDLLFGLDFPKEYEEGWRTWKQARFATFMMPGNHDAYVTYGVRLKGSTAKAFTGLVRCRDTFSAPFDWPKAFALLTCVYGDIKQYLFSDLRADGLSYWRKTFGPPYYSWDYGDLHFVALNTYDGSQARRHSYALWVDAFDLHLGAPAVDNYGGQLSDEQLRWLAADLEKARRQGQTIVVFGHQDPRGNLAEPAETRFLANQPFPTSPLGLGPFQEWNYDSASWSSDGSRRVERPAEHSGTRLVRLLARYASYYIDGHAHKDSHRVYAPGEEIVPGVRARHPIEFLRVTTAASVPLGDRDYWGYRLITVDGRTLATAPYDAGRGLLSIPAGNFWTEAQSATRVLAYNGLPHAVRGRLRLRLPRRPEGWKFLDVWGHVEVPLYEVAPDALGGAATYYVGVEVAAPAATQGFPVRRGWQRKRLFEAVPATGNHPPVARLAIQVEGEVPPPAGGTGPASAPAGSAPAVAFLGQRATITTEGSSDPDGDAIIASFLTTPEGEEVRATEVRRTFTSVGRFRFRAEVLDAHGVAATVTREVAVVVPPPPLPLTGVTPPASGPAPGTQPAPVRPGPRGCSCRVGGAAVPRGAAAALLLTLLLLGRRRRRAL
jgi:MYXO-CTERM domain-containing protein